ncbi:DUF4224 domain-containing protein [Shewanella dokdonensis]|uniref:DUF4224 domain-containing protein n=1 Tax=Shewanella dokdonensis TaxID=712036 RepID=A0ABX8DFH5_9GAMM|nr:DUF4224 domain-containing protein [Shewanella dokdonensis]MCL1072942.1 DUF4224 domain-containing protein [Shewanella dokdonensis]QVK23135.1 DUF4224 domain-containing protein [Shewanella dokdonensis]
MMAEPIPEMTFLTEQEVEYITGAKIASLQISILAKNGINHIVDRNGKPRLTWYQLNNPVRYVAANDGPDFSKI